jgi:pimeloyl-ACP methyl ester carboxylesterase
MQKHFDYKGTNVYYLDEGSGNVIVLIHGFGEDSSVWQGQTAFLQTRFRVITPDIPGSGQSAYNVALVSIDGFADVIYALLQHENITNCIMLGHSLGGYITLAFAEKYPQYPSGFGLVHSTAFADSDEKKQARQKGIQAIGEYGSYAFIKNTTPNLFSAWYKKNSSDKIEMLVAKGADFKKEALQKYYRAMMTRPDRTQVLKNGNVPVLFIAGAEDVAVPLSDLLKQVHLPQTSHIHILENSGHMGLWEEKDKTNEAIAAFAEYVNAQDT